jgi:hypothetical protein
MAKQPGALVDRGRPKFILALKVPKVTAQTSPKVVRVGRETGTLRTDRFADTDVERDDAAWRKKQRGA